MSLSCEANEWEVLLTVEYFPPLAECSDRPAGHSQHSQPVWAPFEFDAAEVDAFEERAAIMEFDGGLERNAAEVKALMSVLAGRSTSRVAAG